ncbi:hypothetical protein FS837_012649 [Tulasnella sp. UAMH 9824]|nr:hypothetical protein FS837_012649 [Tulasnella sp. UAMH 9824]
MGLSFHSRYTDDDILYQLIAEVGRWQDVSINFAGDPNHWLGHLQRLGNQNAPKLRKLGLSAEWLGISRRVLNLFNPHDPCGLEDLALLDVPMVWDGLKFQHLRRLRISEVYEMAPSLAEMLWILERNPRLEDLWLSDMKLNPANIELSGIRQPVLMDFLSYLNLDIYEHDSLGGLVRMMRFPNCRQIKLRPITAPDPDSVYSLTHLLDAARHSIAVTETKASVDYCNLETCTDGGREVEIDIEDEPQLALSEFIKVSIAALAASPAVTLILKDNFSYKWAMHVISALAPLRSITALKFLGRIIYDDIDDVCNPLDYSTLLYEHGLGVGIPSPSGPVSEPDDRGAGDGGVTVLPLKEVEIVHEEEWGLQGCCDAIFDEMQAVIPRGNLKVWGQRWRTGPIA